MPVEQTSVDDQRRAFRYLREHAISAHLAGDGLLTSLLSNSGLNRAIKLKDARLLQLPMTELAWIPIFAAYWLLSLREAFGNDEMSKKLSNGGAEDAAISTWLEIHWYLIQQPMSWSAELLRKLITLPWSAFFTRSSIEAETLLTHLIELTWFRTATDGAWDDLAEAWEQSAPSWVNGLMVTLRNRLKVQTRLTVPGKRYPNYSESDTEELRKHSVFAELWLLHLQGRSQQVCTEVERLTPNISGDSHQWRVIGDFANIDGRFTGNGELDSVYLARRRRLSVETPLLIFHDKRREQIANVLGEIFRAHRKEIASRRLETLSLAMLHEISALRLWDYFMWLEAIRAEAGALLESVRWGQADPKLVAHAILLAVRGTDVENPDNDAIIRQAIDVLEFAEPEVLAELSEGILATYPRLKHAATTLLDDISDLIPEKSWPQLAQWTIAYAAELAEHRTNGFRAVPTRHWIWTLPAVSPDSSVWSTLLPEILRIAKTSNLWVHSEACCLLQIWFFYAPILFARAAGEAMHSALVGVNELRLRETQTGLLLSLEQKRPELHGVFTKSLARTAQSLGNSLRLARHLALPDLIQREDLARQKIIELVQETIARAAPPTGTDKLEIYSLPEVALVK